MRITDLDNTTIKHYISEDLRRDPLYEQHWNRIDEEFFKPWQKYLSEVALTQDQISQIFAAAEKEAGAGGENSTMLGKIVDKIIPDSFLGKLEKSLPEPDPKAQPDPQFEKKASAAVQQLDVPEETKGGLMKVVAAAVKNPAAQGIVLSLVGGVLGGLMSKAGPLIATFFPGGGTAAVAITGAIVAGGVAIASAKLQGKGWKEAFKGAIKPALAGAAGAVVGQMAANFAAGAVDAVAGAVKGKGDAATVGGVKGGAGDIEQGLAADQAFQDSVTKKFPPGEGYTYSSEDGKSLVVTDPNGRKVFTGDIPLKTMDMKTFADLTNNGKMATPGTSSGSVSSDVRAGIDMPPDAKTTTSEIPGGTRTTTQGTGIKVGGEWVRDGEPLSSRQMAAVDMAQANGNPVDPKVQAAYDLAKQQGPRGPAPNRIPAGSKVALDMSYVPGGKKLSEGQVYMLFNRIVAKNDRYLIEGRLVEGPMDWLKTKAKNLTTKVTADKLNSAWKKAGSPMDSDQVAKFLQDQGVDQGVVDKVFADLKLPAGGAAAADQQDPATADAAAQGAAGEPAKAAAGSYADVKKLVMSLDKKNKQRLMKYVTKQLGTA